MCEYIYIYKKLHREATKTNKVSRRRTRSSDMEFLKPTPQLKHTAQITLVGFQHYGNHDLRDKSFELVAEPQNKYDRSAVAVRIKKGSDPQTVAYVSRSDTAKVHAILRTGRPIHTMLLRYNQFGPKWLEADAVVGA